MSKYIVISTKNKDAATHEDKDHNFFTIRECENNAVVQGNSIVILDDIGAFIPLQSYLEQLSRELESAKVQAVKEETNKFTKELEKGVMIAGIMLPASDGAMTAFTQGMVLINTVESIFPDKASFQNMMISKIFGRSISDVNNNPHDISIAQYKQLVIAYGQAIGNLQGVLAKKIIDIKSVATEEQLDSLMEDKVSTVTFTFTK